MKSLLKLYFFSAVLFCLLLRIAFAEKTYYLEKSSDYCDIFRSLTQEIPSQCLNSQASKPKTRGLYLPLPEKQTMPQTNSGRIALRVEFATNSNQLNTEAKQILDQVAAVLLHDTLSNSLFLIEGHADSRGSSIYNFQLSELRALSVRDYLIQKHGISAKRLPIAGFGESRLFDPLNPTAGVNRRVEFVNLQAKTG